MGKFKDFSFIQNFLTDIIFAMIQISQYGWKVIEIPHCEVVPRVLTEKDWLRSCLAQSFMPLRVYTHIQGVLFKILRFKSV